MLAVITVTKVQTVRHYSKTRWTLLWK